MHHAQDYRVKIAFSKWRKGAIQTADSNRMKRIISMRAIRRERDALSNPMNKEETSPGVINAQATIPIDLATTFD